MICRLPPVIMWFGRIEVAATDAKRAGDELA